MRAALPCTVAFSFTLFCRTIPELVFRKGSPWGSPCGGRWGAAWCHVVHCYTPALSLTQSFKVTHAACDERARYTSNIAVVRYVRLQRAELARPTVFPPAAGTACYTIQHLPPPSSKSVVLSLAPLVPLVLTLQVGAAKLNSDLTLNWGGIEGFRLAGKQGIPLIAACQAVLMGGPEYAR